MEHGEQKGPPALGVREVTVGSLPEGGEVARSCGLSALIREIARTPLCEPGRRWDQGIRPGATVGRFDLLRELGRGGFGVVYEARDRELGRLVAVKVIRTGYRSADELREEALRREADAAAQLQHPNVVTLFDSGSAAGTPYLVFEFLSGETLEARLGRGPFTVGEAVHVAADMARALAHGHALGVVHRDLKPSNVFLTRDGGVKVLDFGLAHVFGWRGPIPGGTPAYMAPEQQRNQLVDERADVFAAGAILFEMLSGARPFRVHQGRTSASEELAPHLRVGGAPRPLVALVARCLSRNPARRPRDGQALLERLIAIERSLETPAPPRAGLGALEPTSRSPAVAPAKISRPKLPRSLLRSRLLRRLDAARGHSAIWVAGLPGSGKTTLVASWLESRRLRTLWYQVDSGDGDVATFFYYLGQAALAASGPRKRALPIFTPEYRGGLSVFARGFFRQLGEQVRKPFALVLDNYQEAPLESPLHTALREGIQELPAGATVVVVSRTKPPPVLARLCAYGSIAVLSGDELKLTPREARGIARLRRATGVSQRLAAELADRTDGWAAGLVLMMEHPEPAEARGPVGRRAPQALFDFFAGEIFERMERSARKVLLETALLPKPTADMAERLTGVDRAGRVLRDLASRGYFTYRQGESEEYQYHPLFREFLLARAREELPAARLAELRRAAARLLAEADQFDGAVALLREVGEWEAIARIALAQGPQLIATGRAETLERWLAGVPESVREANPWIIYWLGLARLPSSPAQARSCHQRAFELFDELDDATGLYFAWAGVVDAFGWEWADLRDLTGWIEVLEQLRKRHPLPPDPEIEGRVALAAFTALFFRWPDHPALAEWEERVFEMAVGTSAPIRLRVAAGTMFVANQGIFEGDLERAGRVVDALGPLVRAGGVDPLTTIRWRGAEGAYYWSIGSPARSRAVTLEGLALAGETGIHVRDVLLNFQGVAGSVAGDDPEEAARFLRAMEAALDPALRLNVALFHFATALIALRLGEWSRALRHARATAEQNGAAGCPMAEGFGRFCAARALVGTGATREAQDELDAGRRLTRGIKSFWAEYASALIEATIALAGHEESAALGSLGRALALGRERGLSNDLWFSREETAALCALALEHGVEIEAARQLARHRGCSPGERAMHLENWPWDLEIRTLGGLELRRGGEPVRLAGNSRAALELLELLVVLGGVDVRQEQVAKTLWPDATRRTAQRTVAAALKRLRKLLGSDDVIVQRDLALTVNRRVCFVDAWALDYQLSRGLALLERTDGQGESEIDRLTMRVLRVYRGPFLPADITRPWSAAYREHLHARFTRFIAGRVGQLERAARTEEARLLAGRAQPHEAHGDPRHP
ncbi:MAG: hypothetical protein A2V77_16755 [Anaeromyxobacter sp. RBG_16_69_14]|nr:MAG: hypothetical protein A2V77_16755 [Anaeromyxobacter sp. RBG_16_69_14]